MFTIFKKSKAVSAELEEEFFNQLLISSGAIPEWLSGSLICNGPIYVTVNGNNSLNVVDVA